MSDDAEGVQSCFEICTDFVLLDHASLELDRIRQLLSKVKLWHIDPETLKCREVKQPTSFRHPTMSEELILITASVCLQLCCMPVVLLAFLVFPAWSLGWVLLECAGYGAVDVLQACWTVGVLRPFRFALRYPSLTTLMLLTMWVQGAEAVTCMSPTTI